MDSEWYIYMLITQGSVIPIKPWLKLGVPQYAGGVYPLYSFMWCNILSPAWRFHWCRGMIGAMPSVYWPLWSNVCPGGTQREQSLEFSDCSYDRPLCRAHVWSCTTCQIITREDSRFIKLNWFFIKKTIERGAAIAAHIPAMCIQTGFLYLFQTLPSCNLYSSLPVSCRLLDHEQGTYLCATLSRALTWGAVRIWPTVILVVWYFHGSNMLTPEKKSDMKNINENHGCVLAFIYIITGTEERHTERPYPQQI